MKSNLYTLMLSAFLFGCTQDDPSKTLTSRALTAQDNFNQFSKNEKHVLSIFQQKGTEIKNRSERAEQGAYHVKFADTVISITSPADQKSIIDQFSFAEFLNTQKTSLLVKAAGADTSSFLITVNDGKVEAVLMERPSKANVNNLPYLKDIEKVGRSGYLVNNDYFVTTVNAKVYPVKRQDPDVRILGKYFMNSPDKKTVIFMTPPGLSEYYYPTGETLMQILPANVPKVAETMFTWIQNNYSWQRNESGISWLKKNVDDNRVVDIDEFK